MILSNTEDVPGRAIREFYGVVTGSTVRSKHFGKDLLAGLKNLVGGELMLLVPLVAILAVLSAWPAGITERAFPADGAAAFIGSQEGVNAP